VLNPEGLVQNLHHRPKGVGGAGSSGNDLVLLWIKLMLVYPPKDLGNIRGFLALGRSGDEDALGASLKVPGGQSRIGKGTARFDHHIDPQILPRKGRWFLLRKETNFPAIHQEGIVLCGNGKRSAAVNRVVFRKVRRYLRGKEGVVDGHEFQGPAALHQNPQGDPPNAAKAVDRNPRFCHLHSFRHKFTKNS
jgi:hypothetical protein